MEVSKDIDEFSAPPNGYKQYIDVDKKHGTDWMKQIIEANYPAIQWIQVFHEKKSDMWWNMIVRFSYNWESIDLPVTYQQKMDTLTPVEFQYLSPHIQSLVPETRWLFNVILHHINKLENKGKSIKKRTKLALWELENETTA
jgi:hypothetical protein